MSEIRVSQAHSVSPDEARQRVASFEETLGKMMVKAKWSGNQAKLKGPGVSGSINIDPTEVNVHVKLGLIAKAAGADPVRLKNAITKRLAKAFEDA